jgi:hypothetical protein
MRGFMWRVVQFTFGLEIPHSFTHTFDEWLCGFSKKLKALILTGVASLCWALWLSRNDLVFGTYTKKLYVGDLQDDLLVLIFGRSLQRLEEGRTMMIGACPAVAWSYGYGDLC